MSGHLSPVAGSVIWKPWQKIAAWTTGLLLVLGIGYLFTQHFDLIPWHRKQAQPEPKAAVSANVPAYTGLKLDTAATQPANFTKPNKNPQAQKYVIPADEEEARQSGYPQMTAGGGSASSKQDRDAKDSLVGEGPKDALEASLVPSRMDGVNVTEMPDPTWTIAPGRLLGCEQLTRINSTVPGSVSALIQENVFSDTDRVIILDKGSRISGVLRSGPINGLDRVSILWQKIMSPILYDKRNMPHRYEIEADSPASDEIGQTGLDGDTDHHLLKKVGGILGFSLAQGAIQGGIQYLGSSKNGTSINLNSFQSGGDTATQQLLSAWVNIPDVTTRAQGLRCAVQVARLLNMRGAYQLHKRMGL